MVHVWYAMYLSTCTCTIVYRCNFHGVLKYELAVFLFLSILLDHAQQRWFMLIVPQPSNRHKLSWNKTLNILNNLPDTRGARECFSLVFDVVRDAFTCMSRCKKKVVLCSWSLQMSEAPKGPEVDRLSGYCTLLRWHDCIS